LAPMQEHEADEEQRQQQMHGGEDGGEHGVSVRSPAV
jgi:hypothetical protein